MDYLEIHTLYHSGVKNMKWHKRLYQNKDGSLTPLGRIHYGVGPARKKSKADDTTTADGSESKMAKSLTERRREALRNAGFTNVEITKATEPKPDPDAEKKKAIRSGTAEDILKYKGQLTNNELNEAVSRLDYEKRLIAYVPTKPTTSKKIDTLMNNVEQIRLWSEKAIAAYNTVARVHNALSAGENLPTINLTAQYKKTRRKATSYMQQVGEQLAKSEKKSSKK